MIRNFRVWLGETRWWALIGMLIVTGLASFILQIMAIENSLVIQNALAAAFLVSVMATVGSRMDSQQRTRWAAILLPSFGLVILGVVFLPQYWVILLGAAFGWALISLLLLGNERTPMQYRVAIKAMRDQDYAKAVEAMDTLIKSEPDMPNHYRFRAELLRLWGKLGRARRDYQTMVEKSEKSSDLAAAYNGLAEVDLQAGRYDEALQSAHKAYELASDEWVASYNLGMIADRIGDHDLALDSLETALVARVPDSRHRLLIHLWQARAYARRDDLVSASEAITRLKREKQGLQEWQKILPDEQAKVLRDVLADDVALAERLLRDELEPSQLLHVQEP
ncbi:MAG: tetratricopeptide repeat protein [Anaerolineae bacterium]